MGQVAVDRLASVGRLTCYCGARMVLRTSVFGNFWGCTRWPACDGKVGVHVATNEPLGTPANKQTRGLRIAAHALFDGLWQSGRMKRPKAYAWLADQLGIEESACHIGSFDAETCQRVIALLEELRDGTGA